MKRQSTAAPTTRRQMLAGGAAIIFGSATAGCSDVISSLGDGPTSVTDWQMHRFDAANTGFTPDLGPTSEVTARWSVETDGVATGGTPAVAGETIYVGGAPQTLYALDIATGEERWHAVIPGHTSPAVVDGTVYITGERDERLTILALDAETGDEQWSSSTESSAAGSSPTVADGVIYVGGGGGEVYALNAETGEEEWRYEFDALLRATPAFEDGLVYSGDAFFPDPHGNTVVALDATTGEEHWSVEVQPPGMMGSPAIDDGTVFVPGYDGTIMALSAETGEERWTVEADRTIRRSPAVGDGTLYVPRQNVTAYDAATGEEQWINEDVVARTTDPALTADTVYVTGYSGHVHALDAESGQERWEFEVVDLPEPPGHNDVGTPPAVSGGVVYVAGITGTVYAIEEA